VADTLAPSGWSSIDDRAVATARLLAADAVQAAGNGHPGTAMTLAPAGPPVVPGAHVPRPPATPPGSAGTGSCSPRAHLADPVHPAL